MINYQYLEFLTYYFRILRKKISSIPKSLYFYFLILFFVLIGVCNNFVTSLLIQIYPYVTENKLAQPIFLSLPPLFLTLTQFNFPFTIKSSLSLIQNPVYNSVSIKPDTFFQLVFTGYSLNGIIYESILIIAEIKFLQVYTLESRIVLMGAAVSLFLFIESAIINILLNTFFLNFIKKRGYENTLVPKLGKILLLFAGFFSIFLITLIQNIIFIWLKNLINQANLNFTLTVVLQLSWFFAFHLILVVVGYRISKKVFVNYFPDLEHLFLRPRAKRIFSNYFSRINKTMTLTDKKSSSFLFVIKSILKSSRNFSELLITFIFLIVSLIPFLVMSFEKNEIAIFAIVWLVLLNMSKTVTNYRAVEMKLFHLNGLSAFSVFQIYLLTFLSLSLIVSTITIIMSIAFDIELLKVLVATVLAISLVIPSIVLNLIFFDQAFLQGIYYLFYVSLLLSLTLVQPIFAIFIYILATIYLYKRFSKSWIKKVIFER